jgi:SpoVK/Ycf46/Vps4 family AAA+-type ATPase
MSKWLQKMERFDGIVIMATNLFRDLDAAALRRFTFKMEFLELDVAQRWSMFLREAGLTETIDTIAPATKERWRLKLTLMKFLTPGDFATVKRQCIALDTQLAPDETEISTSCAKPVISSHHASSRPHRYRSGYQPRETRHSWHACSGDDRDRQPRRRHDL